MSREILQVLAGQFELPTLHCALQLALERAGQGGVLTERLHAVTLLSLWVWHLCRGVALSHWVGGAESAAWPGGAGGGTHGSTTLCNTVSLCCRGRALVQTESQLGGPGRLQHRAGSTAAAPPPAGKYEYSTAGQCHALIVILV